MSDPVLPTPILPIWMRRGEVAKIAAAAHNFFLKVIEWGRLPLQQLDPMTCSEKVLDLVAYQRDITRFAGEPLDMYRLRVTYAYVNAIDSGSVAGFRRIFQRLGIGQVDIDERMPGVDWDVIHLILSDSQLAANADLLDAIIRQYGRTCRRYGYSVVTPIAVEIQIADITIEARTDRAIWED